MFYNGEAENIVSFSVSSVGLGCAWLSYVIQNWNNPETVVLSYFFLWNSYEFKAECWNKNDVPVWEEI